MSTHKARLLLVDDDPSAIQVLGRMLSEYPDQRFATSGEVALRLAREATPDLILMDVDMPGMTGFDVCEGLQADPVLAQVPVIFVTSHDESTLLKVIAWDKGAADFITKPLTASQVTSRVGAQLRARRLVEDRKREGSSATLPRPATGQAPRLLIVDDDTASIHILRHTLAAVGDLHFAKSGEEALQLARRLLPDLILVDAHMPGIDGFDVCRSLKAEAAFVHVPIVFVTRFSDPRYEMRALDLGAADFIAKPYTPAVLQARVRNLLELKRRTDSELRAVREHWRQVGDARVADIVSAASDAIVTYDATDRVVLINAAARRMFGVDNHGAIGLPAQTLLGRDLPIPGSGRGEATCATIARANGERLSVELSVSSVGTGADRLTTVMLRDNSDRERLEAESRSRIEAETISRTKTTMMAYIAHEMGNPLNGLLGFTQLIAEDVRHPLDATQARRLELVIASGRQLQGLMLDVMDLGRFESGKLSVELVSIDASECVQDASDAVSAQAQQAGVTVLVEPVPTPCRVVADAGRLHQCLVNLLTNAIKYNQPGGSVRISVSKDVSGTAISVRDDGMGMDAQQRLHLFEPFNRLGRQDDAAPGTGLGLVITRQLVEAMHGELRVESEPHQGSCFSIVLPDAADVADIAGALSCASAS